MLLLAIIAATTMATTSVFQDLGSDENVFNEPVVLKSQQSVFCVSVVSEEPVRSMVVTLGFSELVKIVSAVSANGNEISVTELGNNSFKFSAFWKDEPSSGTLATIKYSVDSSESAVEPVVLESKVRGLDKINDEDSSGSNFEASLNNWKETRDSPNLVDIKLEIQEIEVI